MMMSLEQPSPAPAGALQAEAAVRQGHVVVSASLERALKSRVLAVCAGPRFKGQEVSIILWSLATLSVAVDPALLSTLLLQVPPPPSLSACLCAECPLLRLCVCVLFALIDAGSGQGNDAHVLSAIGVQCPMGPRNLGSVSFLSSLCPCFCCCCHLWPWVPAPGLIPAPNPGAPGLQAPASMPVAREAGNIICLCLLL